MAEKQKILIVDDDANIAELISLYLTKECYETKMVFDGEEALQIFPIFRPNLILLDLMLPGIDGYQVCREIRKKSDVPIIMITAKGETFDKVLGLELGSDDYVVKPFLPQELLLRVHAVLRRCYKADSPLLELEGCTIDFSRAEVNKNGIIVTLTAKEHTLLETLSRNEGRIVSIDALCEALWGDNPFGYENSLNAHIRRIREKIETDPSKPVSLITIKGLGYKLNARK